MDIDSTFERISTETESAWMNTLSFAKRVWNSDEFATFSKAVAAGAAVAGVVEIIEYIAS